MGGLCARQSRRSAPHCAKIIELGLVDAFRQFEQPEKSFSWWDYRQGAFRRNNGLRIDLILVHRQLLPRLAGCRIDAEPRRVERASDHTPVVATIRNGADPPFPDAASTVSVRRVESRFTVIGGAAAIVEVLHRDACHARFRRRFHPLVFWAPPA